MIEGADQIEVSFSDKDTLRATLVGGDPSTDIAVLRVEASSRGLTPLELGNSGRVRVGDPVVAIGNPFGLARTATAGIVSAVQERTITAPNGYPIDRVIQTDAPINSGNSGGPLLNDLAQVIGVNSLADGGAAARAGLKGGRDSTVVAGESYTLGGDVIVAVAGKRVASLEELRDRLSNQRPGETVKLEICRGTRSLAIDVKLGRQPSSPSG